MSEQVEEQGRRPAPLLDLFATAVHRFGSAWADLVAATLHRLIGAWSAHTRLDLLDAVG